MIVQMMTLSVCDANTWKRAESSDITNRIKINMPETAVLPI